MPDGPFDIKVQYPDRTETIWRDVSADQIFQLFPAVTDAVHIDASSTGSSPFVSASDRRGGVTLTDAEKNEQPKFGSLSVHSVFKMRKVSISNTAGGNVANVPADEQNATFRYVLPDTYNVTAVLLDGRRQTISNVQVAAGAVSTVELTADSIDQPSSTSSSSKTNPSGSDSSHTILIHGLEQGDRVSLSQPDSEVASAIAEANSDVRLENVSNGDYALNISFSNGNMANRRVSLTSSSASTVTYDFSRSRGTPKAPAKSHTGWIIGGLLIAAGGAIAWKYKDKI